MGVGPPSVISGPPNISGSKRARKLKLKNAIRHSKVLASVTKNIPLGGVQGAQGFLT